MAEGGGRGREGGLPPGCDEGEGVLQPSEGSRDPAVTAAPWSQERAWEALQE